MSSFNTLRNLTKNNILGDTVNLIENVYTAITDIHGLQSIEKAIKDTETTLSFYSTDTSSEEYIKAKDKYDGLIKEQTLQNAVVLSSIKNVATTIVGQDNSHFENFGEAGARVVLNRTIFIERATRTNIGKDGQHVDISLGVAVIADLITGGNHLFNTIDELIDKRTADLSKKVAKPWKLFNDIIVKSVGDSLSLLANSLVDEHGNSKMVYYTNIDGLQGTSEYDELIKNNTETMKALNDVLSKDVLYKAFSQITESMWNNLIKSLAELETAWQEALTGTSNSIGITYYGKETNDTLIGTDDMDYLIGREGNDVLDGLEARDYLEGGQGFDTYHIKDHDTIYDKDGKGKILFDGKALPKEFIRHFTTDIWYAKDSQGNILYTAIKDGDNLNIHSEQSPTDKVTLKDFFLTAKTSGTTYSALSITLADSQADADKYGVYSIKTDDKLHSNVCTKGFSKTQANNLHYQYIA